MPTPELTQCVIDLALSDPVRHAAHAVALRQHSARALRQPVSVVGPREASDVQLQCAYRVGRLLGSVRVPVLCGGKNGVMASVSRGVSESGGIVVGLLPEDDTSLANPHLTVALPTGLGITRNALVARAASVMVAIGGGLGTTSEMALALQWGKPVLAIHEAPEVAGRQHFQDETALLLALLGLLA